MTMTVRTVIKLNTTDMDKADSSDMSEGGDYSCNSSARKAINRLNKGIPRKHQKNCYVY